MQCPNCNYKLVLFSNRRKYKCALCSKLYPQKQAEDKAFRELNLRERKLDITNLKTQIKQESKQIGDIKKALRNLFNGVPKSYSKEYINKKSREYREKHREQDLKRKREYRQRNQEIVNLRSRIRNHRIKQKQLALLYLKNKQYKLCTNQIQKVLPTNLLAELLFKSKPFYRG